VGVKSFVPESRKRNSSYGGVIYRDEGDKGDNYLDPKPQGKGIKSVKALIPHTETSFDKLMAGRSTEKG